MEDLLKVSAQILKDRNYSTQGFSGKMVERSFCASLTILLIFMHKISILFNKQYILCQMYFISQIILIFLQIDL